MTKEHLSTDALSDLDAGLLPPRDAATAVQHVESCASCAETLQALAQVRASLAALTDTAALPPDVGVRLQHALATEARLDAEPVARLRPVPQATAPRRSPRRWAPKVLVAASVVGALGLGGTVVAALTGNGSPPSGPAAAPAASSPDPAPAEQQRSTADASGATAGGGSPAAPGEGDAQVQRGQAGPGVAAESPAEPVPNPAASLTSPASTPTSTPSTAGAPPGGSSTQVAVTRSERDYAPEDLAAAAPALASPPPETAPGLAPPAARGTTGNPAARLAQDAALLSCATGLQLADRLVAVDIGRFEGAPAAIFVANMPADPSQLDVRVVGPACSADQAQLLSAQRVSR